VAPSPGPSPSVETLHPATPDHAAEALALAPWQTRPMDPTSPLRPVTEDEVATFWRDGVVCLRGVMPLEWLDRMVEPIDAVLAGPQVADLSAMGDALEAGAGATRAVDPSVASVGRPRGRFRAGTDHWCDSPDFRAFALRSPLGPIVARLLDSEQVRLYEDSLLVKEPGTEERTAFHQDMAYFHLEGDKVCTAWVPLDPVTTESGALRFVVGSHLDRTTYRPNLFVTTMALPDTEGSDVPDYDRPGEGDGAAPPGRVRIISFDTEPGDITVHHARTIHGAHANASIDRRRRAISVRYAGDGVTFAPVSGAPPKAHHESMVAGDPLDPAVVPLAWPRP
jgi:ectoine hydroxylase-related dioxygenase (phytanoyl-CoA dioxygenase family)